MELRKFTYMVLTAAVVGSLAVSSCRNGTGGQVAASDSLSQHQRDSIASADSAFWGDSCFQLHVKATDYYNAAIATFEKANTFEVTSDLRINLAPRLRMSTLYAVAQGQGVTSFVVNTCNASEDYVGYSTKYGDAAGDVSLLQDFTVHEVLQIGEYLGLPESLVHKTPSDGLSGMSDEDKLGFTYAQLDEYISGNKEGIPADIIASIERKHVANLHKLQLMPAYKRS